MYRSLARLADMAVLFALLLAVPPAACRRAPAPAPEPSGPVTAAPDAKAASDAQAPSAVAPAAVAPAARAPLPPNLPPGRALALLYSANLHGEYDSHPLGGLGRRASAAAAIADGLKASKGGVIQVDAGDSLLPAMIQHPDDPPADAGEVERRARLLAAGLARLRLDGFVPGETDLALGPAHLKAMLRGANIPVVLANLVDASSRPFFPPHRTFTVAGVKVGIFGVLGGGAQPPAGLAGTGLSLSDAKEAAQGAASLLRDGGAELVIGLAHLPGGMGEARQLAAAITGVDVLVVGHEPAADEEPVTVADEASGQVFLVSAGERGRYLGDLQLHLQENGNGFRAPRTQPPAPGAAPSNWLDNEVIRLNERFISDPKMLALIAPYIKESRRRIERKLPVGLTARAGTHGELADGTKENWAYATTSACAMCHPMARDQYLTTSHAFALATLERKARQRDPYCLGCHATGFDVPGGTRNLQTVNQYFGPTGCESCHGPSANHVRAQNKTGTSRKVASSVCLGCHRSEHSPEPFDVVAAMKEILGPGHGK
jgi:2',3'-cyclic-nucleotide 2'-phosphodiesterase (5'-nucleotidase family)